MTLARANLQQAAAELRGAEANYKRSRELLAKKYISDAQHEANLARLDKARAAVESQKAALASARANRQAAEVTVEQTLIRAPFDAIVLTKNADVGDSSPALRAPSAEALLLGLVGGLADLAFRFTLTPSILAKTIAFALAMALIGGFLPAVRAARLEIVDALRAS